MPIVFDEKKATDGAWCDWVRGVRVKIRTLSRSKFRAFQKESSFKDYRFDEAGRRVIDERIDQEKLDRLIYDHLIEDWEGIVDSEGKPLPCTAETKVLVTDAISSFANWVVAQSNDLEQQEAERLEAQEKNSKGSHGGTPYDRGLAAEPAK